MGKFSFQTLEPASIVKPGNNMNLTSYELHGLRAIVMYLHSLPPTRKNVPDLLANPVTLIHDVRTLVEQHRNDQAHLAVTGVPVIGAQPVFKVNKTAPISSTGALTTINHIVESEPQPSLSRQQEHEKLPLQSDVKVEPLEVKAEEVDPDIDSPEEKPQLLVKGVSPFPLLQNQLKQQMQQQRQESARKLKAPICVIRPITVGPCDSRADLQTTSGSLLAAGDKKPTDLILRREVLLPVLQRLPVQDLLVCMRVCRSWNRCTIEPSLWPILDLSHRQLTPTILTGIVRRQTPSLLLDWSSLNSQHLTWLIDRLPRLSVLSLQGCSAAVLGTLKPAPVSSPNLARFALPKLRVLDLSWVSGVNDTLLDKTILSSSLSGSTTCGRLSHLKELALAGCEISDASLVAIASSLPHLELLCLAFCVHYSWSALETLLMGPLLCNLRRLDLSGCKQLFDVHSSLEKCVASYRSTLSIQIDFSADPNPVVHRCVHLKWIKKMFHLFCIMISGASSIAIHDIRMLFSFFCNGLKNDSRIHVDYRITPVIFARFIGHLD